MPRTSPAQDLERVAAALRERAMRRAVLLERLGAMDAAALVDMLAEVVDRAAAGRAAAWALLQELALEPLLLGRLPYGRLAEAYRIARERDREDVARLLLGEGAPAASAEEAEPGNVHLDLPLGLRRAAARGRDRFVLDRLLHDRDPRVVRLLLDNPRIVERDVVRIAAMRPTRPEILEAIATHRRWGSRPLVRKAIVANPHAPLPLARRLLRTLLRQDVRHLVHAGALRAELEDDARALLGLAPLPEPPPPPPEPPRPEAAAVETTPEEDAELERLAERMRRTLEGAPGGFELVPVDPDEPSAPCLLPGAAPDPDPPGLACGPPRRPAAPVATTPEEDAELARLAARLERSLAGLPGGFELVPVTEE